MQLETHPQSASPFLTGAPPFEPGRRGRPASAEETSHLSFSEDRMQQLMNSFEEGLVVLDGGLILEANRAMSVLLGCPLEEVLWNQLADFVAPGSRPALLDGLRPETPKAALELTGRKSDGTEFPMQLSCKAAVLYKGRRVVVASLHELPKTAEFPLRAGHPDAPKARRGAARAAARA